MNYNLFSEANINQIIQNSANGIKKDVPAKVLTDVSLGGLGYYAINSATNDDQGRNAIRKVIPSENLQIRRTEERIEFSKRTWRMKEMSAVLLNHTKEYTTKKNGESTNCRVWHCGKTPITKVTIIKDDPLNDHKDTRITRPAEWIEYVEGEKGNRYYSNLQHCASYWVCPVCAGKIAMQRIDEIHKALKIYIEQGYDVYFGALTLPHYQHEGLTENIQTVISGFDWTKEHRAVKSILDESLIYLRSLEITFGENGWHPHLHPIFILPKGKGQEYTEMFRKYWLRWLGLNGKLTNQTERRAVLFERWDKKIGTLSDYVCKWSIGKEVANGQRKQSKSSSGYTPFQMLELLIDNKGWRFERSPGDVFTEYAKTIKGKRMIQTSRGFFDDVRVEVKTDEEIVSDDTKVKTLFSVSRMVWRRVIEYDLRFDLIRAYEVGGIDHVQDIIDYVYDCLMEENSS